MKTPAWIAVAAVPALLLALAVPSIAGDPDAIRRSIFGDENQSRLENERLQREHNERLNRAMREMERMDSGSSGKTYYLGGCDVNPNDPSCMLDKERADEGRSPPPQQSPTYDPYASKPYPPAGGRGDCEPSGLFGAPPQDCIDLSKPKPKPLPMYIGEGPCRHDKNGRGVNYFFWGSSRECLAYLIKVQTKECGCVFPPGIPRADYLYYGVERSCSWDCRYPVHTRVTGRQ